MVHLVVKNSDSKETKIDTTTNHPFYVQGTGWIPAKDLKTGDSLVLVDESIAEVFSVEIEKLESPVTVYNFEVEDYHTYYVADIGVLVHNDCSVGGKAAKEAGNPLLKGEGNVGTYKELIDAGKRGDNLTPHHMPSAEYMKNNGVSKNNGISMNMEQPATGGRHRLTDTYGRNMTNAEKANYYSLSPRGALAHDVWNAREIYIQQGKYTPEIRQGLLDVIKRNKRDHPNLFNK